MPKWIPRGVDGSSGWVVGLGRGLGRGVGSWVGSWLGRGVGSWGWVVGLGSGLGCGVGLCASVVGWVVSWYCLACFVGLFFPACAQADCVTKLETPAPNFNVGQLGGLRLCTTLTEGAWGKYDWRCKMRSRKGRGASMSGDARCQAALRTSAYLQSHTQV